MKIVYRGGYSDAVLANSMWYEYLDVVKKYTEKGKKVALVVLAKEDDEYFKKFYKQWSDEIEIINHQTKEVDWCKYDLIMIPGGDNLLLQTSLKSLKFGLESFKAGVTLVGDSAGAYVMSAYFYNSPRGDDRGKIIEFLEGFNPDSKIIIVGHANNHKYTNAILLEKVKKFAEEKGLRMLALKENQEKMLDERENLVDFDRNGLW